MLPDSSAVLNAVIAKLGADSELLALLPDNVYEDIGPPNAKRFAIVSQILATDTAMFHQGRVIEDALLLVEARVLKGSGGDAAAAAARIDALLDDGALDVSGYRVTALHREEFVRGTEVDEVDPTIVWKRRGGRYRVTAYREVRASVVFADLQQPLVAEEFGAICIGLWFDGALTIAGGGSYVWVQSSNPAIAADQQLFLSSVRSDVSVTDPAAPGRAMLFFTRGADMRGWAGVTFTLSEASPRGRWDQILNRETGEPVLESFGDLVCVFTVV